MPGILAPWAAEVTRQGYIIRSCVKNPTHPDHWDVVLFLPNDLHLPKFEWTTEIAGWKPSKSLGSEPAKKGILQVFTVAKV